MKNLLAVVYRPDDTGTVVAGLVGRANPATVAIGSMAGQLLRRARRDIPLVRRIVDSDQS